MFSVWDQHRKHILAINFVWLCDLSESEVDALTKYYATTTREFSSFLGSLGLKHHDGRNKAALNQLKKSAAARGWK